MFTFENLDVYRKSLSFVKLANQMSKDLKGKVSYSVIDQMTRAVLSIPLNIAEGAGRWGRREKIQFVRIARGSVYEIVPILQVLHQDSLIETLVYRRAYGDLEDLAKMLTRLAQSYERMDP